MANVTFFGLCAIGKFDGEMWAVMPGGNLHKTTLLVQASMCKLKDPDPNPNPDIIAHDANNVQWLGWKFGPGELRFAGQSGNAAWAGAHQDNMINLAKFHPNAPIKPRPGNATAFRLTAGDLLSGPTRENYIIHEPHKPDVEDEFGSAATWKRQGGVSLVDAHGKEIVEVDPAATLVISSLAAAKKGEQHFHMYYDSFFVQTPGNQITIERRRGRVASPTTQRFTVSFNVYDCVPPVPLP